MVPLHRHLAAAAGLACLVAAHPNGSNSYAVARREYAYTTVFAIPVSSTSTTNVDRTPSPNMSTTTSLTTRGFTKIEMDGTAAGPHTIINSTGVEDRTWLGQPAAVSVGSADAQTTDNHEAASSATFGLVKGEGSVSPISSSSSATLAGSSPSYTATLGIKTIFTMPKTTASVYHTTRVDKTRTGEPSIDIGGTSAMGLDSSPCACILGALAKAVSHVSHLRLVAQVVVGIFIGFAITNQFMDLTMKFIHICIAAKRLEALRGVAHR
ncbi:hypothetical protein MBLNU459_g8448t1 [Dothideomycetes sp. NU459]